MSSSVVCSTHEYLDFYQLSLTPPIDLLVSKSHAYSVYSISFVVENNQAFSFLLVDIASLSFYSLYADREAAGNMKLDGLLHFSVQRNAYWLCTKPMSKTDLCSSRSILRTFLSVLPLHGRKQHILFLYWTTCYIGVLVM